MNSAEVYLAHYGYLPIGVRSVAVDEGTRERLVTVALVNFQIAAGLPTTGELDEATQTKMSQPRCGCLDVQRNVVEWARWRKTDLKYFVEKRVTGLAADVVDGLIAAAWQDWMAVADIRIAPTNSAGDADMIISTGRGRGDGFDGPSGTLAWAYLPSGNDGQLLCRFDADETWLADNPQGGILLRNVACHEFGHLLGLEHSRVSSALMAPFYSPAVTSPRQSDDIPRIQGLYGKPTAPPQPGPPLGANMIRLAKTLPAGVHGDFTLGSAMGPGDYLALLAGDGPPPPIPNP